MYCENCGKEAEGIMIKSDYGYKNRDMFARLREIAENKRDGVKNISNQIFSTPRRARFRSFPKRR